MDWKSALFATVAVVLSLRPELRGGEGNTEAAGSRKTDGVVEAVNTLVTLNLVCAGIVTDKQVEIGRSPFNENRPQIAVHTVFFGDPDTKDVILDDRSITLEPGTRHILFARGGSPCKWVTHALPDDAVTRRRVQEALAAHFAEALVAAHHDYLDVDRFLDEAEELVGKLVASIATASPEHPFLGRQAIQQVKVRRVAAPPGVYVRIAGGMEETETNIGRRTIPRGENAVLLWVGIGIGRNRQFRIGAPTNPWGDASYGAALTPEDAGREPLTLYRQEDLFDPSGMFPFSMTLETPHVRNGRQELSDTIMAVFRTLSKEYRTLCSQPPQNTAAALACLRSLSKKGGGSEVPPPSSGHIPFAAFEAETPSAYLALQALEYEWASGRMNELQKKEATSVLLDLLTNPTVVLDQTPCDGPVLRAHQVAYSVLSKISGKDFPAPIQSGPEGEVRPEVLQNETDTPENIKERHEVWKKWWRERNGDN